MDARGPRIYFWDCKGSVLENVLRTVVFPKAFLELAKACRVVDMCQFACVCRAFRDVASNYDCAWDALMGRVFPLLSKKLVQLKKKEWRRNWFKLFPKSADFHRIDKHLDGLVCGVEKLRWISFWLRGSVSRTSRLPNVDCVFGGATNSPDEESVIFVDCEITHPFCRKGVLYVFIHEETWRAGQILQRKVSKVCTFYGTVYFDVPNIFLIETWKPDNTETFTEWDVREMAVAPFVAPFEIREFQLQFPAVAERVLLARFEDQVSDFAKKRSQLAFF